MGWLSGCLVYNYWLMMQMQQQLAIKRTMFRGPESEVYLMAQTSSSVEG